MLAFLVGTKQAFEISLADVSQTQLQGKNDVMLEFHVDDTTGANEVTYCCQWFLRISFSYIWHLCVLNLVVMPNLLEGHSFWFMLWSHSILNMPHFYWSQKDSLMEISFHIPNSNTQFVGDENRPPAQVSKGVSTQFFEFTGGILNLFHDMVAFLGRDWVIWLCLIGFPWQNHVDGWRWCRRWGSCCHIWRHCHTYSKVG